MVANAMRVNADIVEEVYGSKIGQRLAYVYPEWI